MSGLPTQISIVWSADDVIKIAPYLDENRAAEVLQYVRQNHDPDVGVTWDIIDSAIDAVHPCIRDKCPDDTISSIISQCQKPIHIECSKYGYLFCVMVVSAESYTLGKFSYYDEALSFAQAISGKFQLSLVDVEESFIRSQLGTTLDAFVDVRSDQDALPMHQSKGIAVFYDSSHLSLRHAVLASSFHKFNVDEFNDFKTVFISFKIAQLVTGKNLSFCFSPVN